MIQGTENAPSRSANDDGNKASEDEAKIQDGELGLQSQVWYGPTLLCQLNMQFCSIGIDN